MNNKLLVRFFSLIFLMATTLAGAVDVDDDQPQTQTQKSRGRQIRESRDFTEIVEGWGYPVETHKVTTKDGYILTLHRIPSGHNESPPAGSPQKPVVLLYHGLLTCSDLFVCHPDGREVNLALILADAGYDVWLGNNRGNQYSNDHTTHSTTSKKFWDFGIHEIARYDIPAVVEHILEKTGQPSFAYIGYSQGTAQCLAALSMNESLNKKIHLFIGLAVTMKPAKLDNGFVNYFLDKRSPKVLYKLFGRRSGVAPLVKVVKSVFPAWAYAALIDMSIGNMFGWDTKHLSPSVKKTVYSKLYSSGSVRNVVHWFEIITSATFRPDTGSRRLKPGQLEEIDALNEKGSDEPSVADLKISAPEEPLSEKILCELIEEDEKDILQEPNAESPKATKKESKKEKKRIDIEPYPTTRISTKLALFCGAADKMSDQMFLHENLPELYAVKSIEGYGHLDFLWRKGVEEVVYKDVLDLLKEALPPTDF